MGLRDRMNVPAATPPSGVHAATQPAPAPTAPANSAVSTPARRDLGALRARLAGNGGVNPPEAPTAITEAMFEPQTRETPDGGAEAIVESTQVYSPAVGDAADVKPGNEPAKRKRRTKAEMQADAAAAPVVVSCSTSEPVPTVMPVEPTLLSVLARIADALEVLSTRAL